MRFVYRLLRRNKFDANERRRFLLATGRITDGVIIDRQVDADGREVAIYSYTLNGVDFESADILTDEQRADPIKYAPGANVGIRYDQRKQGNSIVE